MLKEGEINYKVLSEPNESIINLLSNTIYGTKGLRYGHRNVKKRVHHLETPDFHTFWKDDELLAVAAYCRRNLPLNGENLPCIYIRYFAVNEKFQGQGLGKLLTQKLYDYYERSINEPTVFYAYIEQKNVRSMGVSKRFKQEPIGTFKTIYFSRFFPKKQKDVVSLSADEAKQLLFENNKNYAFYGNYKLGYENGYRAIKKDGKIVAGIQANKITWDIYSLPGVMGWLTRNVLHFLPVIGRLSPRKTYSFLTFEGVFMASNHEQDFIRLVEHCLAEHNVYSGILPLDITDTRYAKISALPNLGLMHKIQPAPPVSVLVNFYKTDEKTVNQLKTLPKYVSGFDIS